MPDSGELEIFRHSRKSIVGENIEPGLERFHDNHRELYGYAMSEEPIELVTLRATATPPATDGYPFPSNPPAIIP